MYQNKALLLVTYDLHGTAAQQGKLFDVLKNEQWWHYISSTWLISTTKTPKELTEALLPFIEKSDRLLVVRLTREHWGWLPSDAWDWMAKNAPPASP